MALLVFFMQQCNWSHLLHTMQGFSRLGLRLASHSRAFETGLAQQSDAAEAVQHAQGERQRSLPQGIQTVCVSGAQPLASQPSHHRQGPYTTLLCGMPSSTQIPDTPKRITELGSSLRGKLFSEPTLLIVHTAVTAREQRRTAPPSRKLGASGARAASCEATMNAAARKSGVALPAMPAASVGSSSAAVSSPTCVL